MNPIDNTSANSWFTGQGIGNPPRPDPAQAIGNLFSQLDSSGQDYIEKTDLQAAFDRLAGTSDSSATTTDVDELFSQLDSDADGKVTKEEFTDSLQQALDQLDEQLARLRLGGGDRRPPPPPPPGGPEAGDSPGFTEEELSQQLEEIGSSNDRRAELLSSIVENFDEADTDGDGRVSLREAMAFDTSKAAEDEASGEDGSGPPVTTAGNLSDQVLKQIVDLMRAYGGSGDADGEAVSQLSVSA